MELILAQLKEEGAEKCGVAPGVAHFLASSFQKGCGAVLTLATGSASSDEVQIVNLIVASFIKSIAYDFWKPCQLSISDQHVQSLTLSQKVSSFYVTDTCLLQFSVGSAGGANSDRSAGCAV